MENKRDSTTALLSIRDKVMDLVDEELDPDPPVHNSGRLQRRNVREMEDARYSEGPFPEKTRKKRAPKRVLSSHNLMKTFHSILTRSFRSLTEKARFPKSV